MSPIGRRGDFLPGPSPLRYPRPFSVLLAVSFGFVVYLRCQPNDFTYQKIRLAASSTLRPQGPPWSLVPSGTFAQLDTDARINKHLGTASGNPCPRPRVRSAGGKKALTLRGRFGSSGVTSYSTALWVCDCPGVAVHMPREEESWVLGTLGPGMCPRRARRGSHGTGRAEF